MMIYTEDTIAQAVEVEYAIPTDLEAAIRAEQADAETLLEAQMLVQAAQAETLPDRPAAPEAAPRLSQADDPSLEVSLAQFCEFVDVFTRHARQPLALALACEQQADLLRITAQDATPETIRLLVNTLLDAIERLEQKWLDEQIQRVDLQQTRADLLLPAQKLHSQPITAQSLCQVLLRWLRQRVMRDKPVSQRRPVARREVLV